VRVLGPVAYSILVIGTGWAMAAWLASGHDAALGLVVGQLIGAALIVVLERAWPYRREWLHSRGDLRTDVLHLLVTTNAVTAARYVASEAIAPATLVDAWPTAWPMAAQVALVVLVHGFFDYWIHRAEHGTALLWRLHAVHHSSPRVYWLNQLRAHPIQGLLDGLAIVPAILLGAPVDVLLVFTAVAAMALALQHANIGWRLGALNWIVSGVELHRWHHSRERREADANFGGVAIVWDVVFGTRRLPDDREPPVDTGIAGPPGFPTGYLGQLAAPFRTELWRAP
jgi:sterol desaturase/sphingolipid hydroxylase (fatty acid hydroxylase superfamily)